MSNLTDHVVSLEIAKELKEAGYPQNTLFSWFNGNYTSKRELDNWTVASSLQTHGGLKKHYTAPLASEIVELLPKRFFWGGSIWK
jgi:hypothetical protein